MKNNNPEYGFTIVELIITIVILGILAAAIATRSIDLSKTAHAGACRSNQIALESAQMLYYTQNILAGNGHYAESIDLLAPYLIKEEVPQCPSGGTYQFRQAGKIICSIVDHQQ